MKSNNECFRYTYSAKRQEEVKAIRDKYVPKEEDKMEQLRRLDESTTRPGMVTALVVGIISSLILGVGMCCCMVWGGSLFIPGIFVGVIGLMGVCMAYPLYGRITNKRREKLAPEIMRLADELMG